MASYFRHFFGVQPSLSGAQNSKSHKRSPSAPTPSVSIPDPSLSYIYAAPGTAHSSSSRTRERSNSYVARTNTPSPLRYAAYDSGSTRSKGPYDSGSTRSKAQQSRTSLPLPTPPPQPQPQQPSTQKPSRVHMYRSMGNKPGDRPAPYPIYAHSSSFGSVHSASSSSLHPGSSASGHRPPPPPRTASSGSVAPSEPRPALKQNHTWNGSSKSGPQAHVSFLNPNRRTTLHMHPLLAYSRLHRPPISYDVSYTPSSRTVVDRSTLQPVPAHTLAQPATEPATLMTLTLKSDKFPWTVTASSAGASASNKAHSGARFYLGGSSSSHAKLPNIPVTNLDVLYAIHTTLTVRVTQQEWEALGHGSRAQRKATRAYERRCMKMGGGWDGGVRRIDFLGEKTRLIGVEVDKTADGGAGKLVFGKA
ncbi:hypothetical protein BDZ94DRAFT_1291265 [Collybia nuda]|uniref:DUF6699 domain-containing protein n=1 Tax=Collybia nuda TaxID=64659 RepID=A0A9P6CC16_9AGAR|nr:hypothetical protein BDZ94DRAFT_1291265 [Collybia nuda]